MFLKERPGEEPQLRAIHRLWLPGERSSETSFPCWDLEDAGEKREVSAASEEVNLPVAPGGGKD